MRTWPSRRLASAIGGSDLPTTGHGAGTTLDQAMAAWIFQANPKAYDIDGALGALTEIWWRAPQHTAELRPVILSRSGGRGRRLPLWQSGA